MVTITPAEARILDRDEHRHLHEQAEHEEPVREPDEREQPPYRRGVSATGFGIVAKRAREPQRRRDPHFSARRFSSATVPGGEIDFGPSPVSKHAAPTRLAPSARLRLEPAPLVADGLWPLRVAGCASSNRRTSPHTRVVDLRKVQPT